MRRRLAAVTAAAALAAAAHEELVELPGGGSVGLSTSGSTALRVRLHPEWHREAFDTPMVAPAHEDAPFEKVDSKLGKGISSAVGSVLVTKHRTLLFQDPHGRKLTESRPLSAEHPVVHLSSSPHAQLYGRGASPDDAMQLTSGSVVHPLVCNRATYTPYYYTTDGYSLLGATNATQIYKFPVVYRPNATDIEWHVWVRKGAFQLYFMPAETLAKGTQAYYALTGAPLVPPRYAFGFMASRWGWKDVQYIEDTIHQFRKGGFPIDAIIMDFEWFVAETDYVYPAGGKASYTDFGYNPKLLPNPKEQLPRYRDSLHVRFGGLRKPRLGNSQLLVEAKSKGWILPTPEPGGQWPPEMKKAYSQHRNLNFSNPEVRDWYGSQMSHYLDDGVEFWWNDEGETDYFTFHWWNLAESALLTKKNPTKRFYSLNRAWSPGMARMGATVWTGDIDSSWEDLRSTPGMLLNWVLGGAPYVACDIGGFNGQAEPQLLVRWMQLGIFLPTMRVHSVVWAKPHFPWLFGPQAANAIRQALEVRYRLLPYHYSLAHRMYESIRNRGAEPFLWMRPVSMDFPDDHTAAGLQTEWMDGDILVAPIAQPDSTREVYLPKGTWYQRETPHISYGPMHIGGTGSLWEVPQYVKAGTVLPVAGVVQFSDAFPGGPIEVQVYGGADGQFELVEDDGNTYAYREGSVRRTLLTWDEELQQLTWRVSGTADAGGPQSFQKLYLTLFDKSGIRRSEVKAIGSGGQVRVTEKTQYV